jgi:mannosyltransferase
MTAFRKIRSFALPPAAWASIAILSFAAGIGLRVWHIGVEPMWLDEAYSAYAAGKDWHFLWTIVPRYETHPPFYYSVLHVWTLIAGDGLSAYRSLGLICGIATMPVAAWAARSTALLAGQAAERANRIAVAALGAAAMAPVLVMMTREVRPYPVMILVYTLGIIALCAVARRRGEGRGVWGRAYVGYLIAAALMLWLHTLGPLFGLALMIALAVLILGPGLGRRDWLALVIGHMAIGLAYLPALAIMLDQAPTWIGSTWLKFDTSDLWLRVTMIHAGPANDMRVMAALLLIGGLVALWRTPMGRRLAIALPILSLLPVLLSILISATITPVFIVRTMTPLAVPALILIAIGSGSLTGLWRRPMIIALLWLLSSQAIADLRARAYGPQQDWYRAIHWMQQRGFRSGDVVFAYPNEGALPFDRAVRDLGVKMPSVPIPTAVPTLDPPPGSWYVSGSRGVPSLDAAHLHAIAIDPKTRSIPTIWLLRLGPWAYDKGDLFLDELFDGRTEVGNYDDGPIDIVALRRDDLMGVPPMGK